jgi:hypothetical protein
MWKARGVTALGVLVAGVVAVGLGLHRRGVRPVTAVPPAPTVPARDHQRLSGKPPDHTIGLENFERLSPDRHRPGPCEARCEKPVEWSVGEHGGRTREEAERFLRPHAAKVERCFRQAMEERPGLCGLLTITLFVDRNGRIDLVDVPLTTLDSGSLLPECVLSEVRKTKFRRSPDEWDDSDELTIFYRFCSPRPRRDCASNPPPMELAEWQRLVRVLRAHVDKNVHGRYSLRPAYLALVQRAQLCDVNFRQDEPGQVRGRDLFVTALLGGLWAGARFHRQDDGWALTGLDDGSVD